MVLPNKQLSHNELALVIVRFEVIYCMLTFFLLN